MPDNPVVQDLLRQLDLSRLGASIGSNCAEKPSDSGLVLDQPLPALSTGVNLAKTKFLAQPCHVLLTQLSCFDPHSNTEPEPFGRVALDEGHDGSVSIDESSKVRLVDFGNRLSHGVNHARTV